ncbi:TAXI family TRAP transporter solute-binding subunit [Telmatospirillum sp. J64-1]|uniref:TAXI family TRAP transporter solute-binding subunit n=1 Tax=Telmatospirillum sp. J64-1 TaxID=2502183 RepID=UPI00115EEC53|nr:TAXI family TRAP transporter solute-binding subunit [Telmatospirillum sp. J64-1]
MLIRRTSLAVLAAAGLAMASVPASAQQQQRFITIGSGGETGIYYAVATNICRLVNSGTQEHGLRCNAPAGGGSVANLTRIAGGEIELGVAQSDVHYNALEGLEQFQQAGPNEKLRSVFSLHPESFTVVARRDANARTFDELRGKRVNIGNPGSGQRATIEAVMAAKNWTVRDFSLASELEAREQAQALCDNKVDAMVYVVGHPNGSIQEATTSCDSVLVSVDGPDIEQLVNQYPYYATATIPGEMYRGNAEPTPTFGVRATFVTSADVPEDVIYNITKAVFDNLDRFKRQHPAFAVLETEEMLTAGLSAPLHDGAVRYFRERGWME